jgi:hypothetical protein
MRHRTTLVATAIALVALASPRVGAQDEAPKSVTEAVSRAKPLLEVAAKKPVEPQKDLKAFKETAADLRRVHELLKPMAKEGATDSSFQSAWNDLVSLHHYHGLDKIPEPVWVKRDLGAQLLRLTLPASRGWAIAREGAHNQAQEAAYIHRVLSDNRITREIKIWAYQWNIDYSGVGGSNAKNLAEMFLEADREVFKRITFRSDRVVTAYFNKAFPKTSYYEIVGEDAARGPVRRRNYYVKAKTVTFNFEILEWRKASAEDPPWVRWQCEGKDPELEAILASIEERPLKLR